MGVAFIAGHTLLKFVRRQVIQELSENGAAGIHPPYCGGAGYGLPGPLFALSDFKAKNPLLPLSD
jgi:hypothetical protein